MLTDIDTNKYVNSIEKKYITDIDTDKIQISS